MRDRVRINPKLPDKIQSIQLRFRYKRSRIALSVNKKHIAVFVHGFRSGQVTVPIEIAGKLYNVPYGKTHNVTYRS